jgi:hypothetical protein
LYFQRLITMVALPKASPDQIFRWKRSDGGRGADLSLEYFPLTIASGAPGAT